ncbi:hypothetical protein [Glycomyces artemisiae]|uniref:Uncharacterized protein n=1 Tax=Glycomyces artemisiae TaxID=1076443 RepID=A0A2T0UWE7_9ACTN|nr:hypothetical protein [Glycomyces artemisiae]PRY62252.1 hypothetical protein B0I28_101580 [Glycomyces artemisiae]
MAETTLADGWLGDFSRGPAVFTVYRVGPEEGGHPLGPPEYRIECNDGAGPREICRFFGDTDLPAEWFGAWQNDPWCDWILAQANKTIRNPER